MTLPVLMLTSSSEEEERFQSQRLGASHFVRKPVDFQRFAEAVAQLGLHWLLSTHLPTPVVAASP